MKPTRWFVLVALLSVVATLACSTITNFNLPGLGAGTPTPLPPTADPNAAPRQLRVLEAVDEAVREQYVHEDFGGGEWEAAVNQTRAQVAAGLNEDAFTQAIRALLAELPEGSAFYQTREERIQAESTDSNSYQGIGVFYGFRETPEPHIVILSVIQGSPAETAGLKAHDAIYGVEGQPIRADEEGTVSQRIRGPAGTSVTLTVQTPGQARREVTIPRGVITAADPLRGGVLAGSLAYYRIPVFAENVLAQALAQSLQEANQATPLTGVILDLRVAGSSSGWPVLGMLTLFGDGTFGEFYTRTTTETVTVEGVDVVGSQTLPLVILIGPDTRGMPEIFAASLQASGRAKLVGLTTPGDLEGFDAIDLPNGARLQLVTSSFRLANGSDFSITGLTPDVRIESDWDTFGSPEDDPVLEAAVSLLTP